MSVAKEQQAAAVLEAQQHTEKRLQEAEQGWQQLKERLEKDHVNAILQVRRLICLCKHPSNAAWMLLVFSALQGRSKVLSSRAYALV
jgi:hypothetical protein